MRCSQHATRSACSTPERIRPRRAVRAAGSCRRSTWAARRRRRSPSAPCSAASSRRQWAMSCSAVELAPGALTTKSRTASPVLLVRHADAGAFGDPVAGGDDGLDLVGVDVEARDDHHVLLAVDDLQEPALVEAADVAGAEEAVGGEGATALAFACSSSPSSPAARGRRSRRPRRRATSLPSSSISLMSVRGTGSPLVSVNSPSEGGFSESTGDWSPTGRSPRRCPCR